MKKIKIQNFRCYSEQTINFKKGVNLLVGDNATGKTSILKACKYILSSFFSGFSDENTSWLNPSVDDFHQEIVDDILLPEKSINLFFDTDNIFGEKLKKESQISIFDFSLLEGSDSFPFVIEKNSKKNSKPLISGIKELKEASSLLYDTFVTSEGQMIDLPLFASFSTEDIHSKRKLDTGKFYEYIHKPSFGYYECLDGDGFFKYWIKRLLVLKEKDQENLEVDIVSKAIIDGLGENGCNIFKEIHIRPIKNAVYFTFIDGREIESKYLSDGYRRLINIDIDIAFRSALLNKNIFGRDASIKTRGTVLIDEIDLHLHPSLQSLVIKGLRNAFPMIQFIISSHAPMVMTGVESNDNNQVLKLSFCEEKGYFINTINTYGVDISTLTKNELGVVPRAISVEKRLTQLFNYIDEGKYNEGKDLLYAMKKIFEDKIPELSEAETMLNFLIDDDDID